MVKLEETLNDKKDDLENSKRFRRQNANVSLGMGAGIATFFGMIIADGLNYSANYPNYTSASPFNGIELLVGIAGAGLGAYGFGRLLDYLDDKSRYLKNTSKIPYSSNIINLRKPQVRK